MQKAIVRIQVLHLIEILFKGIVCEDGFIESKFDSELLDDNNWSVNDNGKGEGIYIPAIYEGNWY